MLKTSMNAKSKQINVSHSVLKTNINAKYKYIIECFTLNNMCGIFSTTNTDTVYAYYSSFFSTNFCCSLIYCVFILFGRPENTHKGKPFAIQQDLNKLYWVDDTAKVSVSKIQGKCEVVCSEDLSISTEEYFRNGQDRFYFTEVCF